MNQEKRGYEETRTRAMKKAKMGLTSHSAAVDLVIQAPGNDGVVPRQRFNPIPQFFMGTSSEQGA